MSPWTIYWFTRLDPIHETLCALFVIGSILGVVFWLFISFIYSGCDTSEKADVAAVSKRVLWVWGPLMAFSLVGYTLGPTEKEAAAIIILPRLINNQNVQALGDDIPKLAREWIEELRQKSAEKSEPTER